MIFDSAVYLATISSSGSISGTDKFNSGIRTLKITRIPSASGKWMPTKQIATMSYQLFGNHLNRKLTNVKSEFLEKQDSFGQIIKANEL